VNALEALHGFHISLHLVTCSSDSAVTVACSLQSRPEFDYDVRLESAPEPWHCLRQHARLLPLQPLAADCGSVVCFSTPFGTLRRAAWCYPRVQDSQDSRLWFPNVCLAWPETSLCLPCLSGGFVSFKLGWHPGLQCRTSAAFAGVLQVYTTCNKKDSEGLKLASPQCLVIAMPDHRSATIPVQISWIQRRV